jgi:OFA family oxalate/formate antiporter-like MFS transporter
MPNRWIIAAAAVLTHLCLGSVYAWSVFVVPIRDATGWDQTRITWAFSIAIASLGLTAAFASGLCKRIGPRASVAIAAVLFGMGMAGAGLACAFQSRMLLYVLFGIVGGMGLGMGYAPPVATLIRWFPDRRGLATGMAVCGFGAGALLASQAAEHLLPWLGLSATFYALGGVYLPLILLASAFMRLPAADYSPAGWTPKANAPEGEEMPLGLALRSARFWLLWMVFFINISVGIMLVALAKPMASEVARLSATQALWVVPIMGLLNGAGRLGWSAASDRLGRPATFLTMLLLQTALFLTMGSTAAAIPFVLSLWVIISCYGGGFALTPALIADAFGSRSAGQIYGAALTAWSAAALCSPPLGAYLKQSTGGYQTVLFAAAGLLTLGLALACMLAQSLRRQGRDAAVVSGQSTMPATAAK